MEQLKAYINNIQFDCKRGKYDAQQVDEFIAQLLHKIEVVQAQVEAVKAENTRYAQQSASMAAAMITAEKNSAAMIQDAAKQAETILAAARQEGDDYVKSMYDRQDDMEREYQEKKDKLVREIASIKSFKEKYHRSVEKDIIEVLSKISSMDSNKVWNQLPEEIRKEYHLDDVYEGLDLNEIIKDLPETDSELKEMIEGLL